MTCRQALRFFFLYRDSELDPRSVDEVNRHLESCRECRERWGLETALEEAIERAAWRAADPGRSEGDGLDRAALRARLLAEGGAGQSRGAFFSRRSAILSLASALALAAAAGLWWLPRRGGEIERAARRALEHHEELLGGRSSLPFRSRDDVTGFLAGELALGLALPRHPGGAELIGARRCTFLGSPVAYLVYRFQSATVPGESERDATLTLILGPRPPPAALLDEIRRAPGEASFATAGGYRVVLATVEGALFCAVGDVPRADLAALLGAFREAAGERRPGRPSPPAPAGARSGAAGVETSSR